MIKKSFTGFSLLLAAFISQASLANQAHADAVSDWLAPLGTAMTNPNQPSVTYTTYNMSGGSDCSNVQIMDINQSSAVTIGNYSLVGIDQYHCSVSSDDTQLSCTITDSQGVVSQHSGTNTYTFTKNQDGSLAEVLWQSGRVFKSTVDDCKI
jgi:hypothetical protein